ncbi:helix-turn-helix transcriptional regulator [Streptomyces sp. NPDC051561]|uniref:helix-turn-helix transcriptional regulator n=1 Tax=Streptomyces sp. NPDC051561 TaxID=3365658 RepID=UPI00378B0EE6
MAAERASARSADRGATDRRVTAREVTGLKAHRLGELREFLRSRRARISPTEAGLPDGGARRRTPGLRREEVAVLAGVGVSWYQWLEQGRDITVSPQVLDSVARVLRLTSTERRHLYVLADLNPPAPEVDPADEDMCAGLRRMIDAWMPFPAHIMDPYWNTIVYNDAAAAVLGLRPGIVQNCLISFFTDPVYRARAARWEEVAPQVVAQFRATCSERGEDEGFREVVAQAKAASEEFAALWERRDIAPGGQLHKELHHALVGDLSFETTQLRIPARPDLAIVLHTPRPDTGTAEKLHWLASPEGRREGMYPVAG